MSDYKPSDLELEAIALVKREKQEWADPIIHVTPKVAFHLRTLLETCRKNYWGIFDNPTDPSTGREKIWVPLTQTVTEAVVKNIDLDQKDLRFRAKNPDAYPTAMILRSVVPDYLSRMNFGEILDATERQLCIDGTRVWKTWKGKDKKGKTTLKRKDVNLFNFYIDPAAESIQDTAAVIERAVMAVPELQTYDGFINTEFVKGTKDVNPNDGEENNLSLGTRGETPYVEVYERWGLMPKYLITGKKSDKEWVEGRIVVSDVDHNPVLHKIELNKDGVKPYEEARFRKVEGRWLGLGISEPLIMLQLWMNTIVNIRINRSYVAQLGIFKIRQGSGITPQSVSKLAANGAITVQSMDDIEQLVMQEASQASYKDEDTINSWAQRLTNAFEVVTGENLPSSTPATNAVLQDRSAKSAFTMVKEGLGSFLQRWMDNHALPIIASTIKPNDLVRLAGEDEYKDLVDRVVAKYAMESLEELYAAGIVPTEFEMQDAMNRAQAAMRVNGEMFMEMVEELMTDQVETEVYVTNEELDIAVTVQNLVSVLGVAPEYKDSIIRTVVDLMGLTGIPLQKEQPMMNQEMGGAMPQAAGLMEANSAPSTPELTTEANVPSL